MTMMKQLLRVNLSNKKVTTERIDDDLTHKYLGGLGLALFYFIREVPPNLDALNENNKIIFATGPLTGTALSSSGRLTLISKSPINQMIGESHVGTRWGPELKMAGYDLLIVEGASKKPVYLYIDDETVMIEKASDLWGKNTYDATSELYLKYGRIKDLVNELGQTTVGVIGLAGENTVPYSSIVFEKSRNAGACGIGAVMGSKKLKAIVVRGVKELTYSAWDQFSHEVEKLDSTLETTPITGKILPTIGTGYFFDETIQMGAMHICSYLQDKIKQTNHYQIENLIKIENFKDSPCSDLCRIAKCGKYVTLNSESFYVPQFASLWALGPNIGVQAYDQIIQLNYLCNLFGLDTVQFSNIVNLLMEATKQKLFENKFGKFKINFNDIERIKELIELISRRKDIGELLSTSLIEIASKLGLVNLLIQINGLGLTALDPSLGGKDTTQALSFVTSLVSGSFNKSFLFVRDLFDGEKTQDSIQKIEELIFLENYYSLIDSLIICKFSSFAFMDHQDSYAQNLITNAINTAIGTKFTPRDLLQIGEKIVNLQYLYNVASGAKIFSEIPESFFDNESKVLKDDYIKAISLYKEKRGWTAEHDIPSQEKIYQLGLDSEFRILQPYFQECS